MLAALLVPLALQAAAMAVDEGYFHRRRGLPRWERIGHPLDTATIALCLGWLLVTQPGEGALSVYIALAIFSTLFVTKDEAVHARLCTAGEHWLHAILFALHPVVLAALGLFWWTGHRDVVTIQLVLVLAFGLYQLVYWLPRKVDRTSSFAVPDRGTASPGRAIDNTWYAPLGDRWYTADDSPIALLRAEARHRNPWLADQLALAFGPRPCTVLDLGCGAGFLANDLAARGHRVAGLDSDPASLAVARAHDATCTVAYDVGDATRLPHADASFDAVCAMDLLEHVDDPARLVAEAGRVLRPGGLFFFHTFNRTWQAHLIVIKGVEIFVQNAPPDLHVLRLFRTPGEVTAMCDAAGLEVVSLLGSRPRFTWPLWRMLATGRVGDDFAFTFTRSLRLGFTGCARKRTNLPRTGAATDAVA